jgi:hypothetical protein
MYPQYNNNITTTKFKFFFTFATFNLVLKL